MDIVERDFHPTTRDALIDSGIHSVLARVYAARGIESAAALEYRLARLTPPAALAGLDAAAEIVATAITAGDLIAVVGDFDADGATATAILHEAIIAFGGPPPFVLIPSRFTQGYGLSLALVDAARDGGARVIVTVDNGITAFEAIGHARKIGLPVVVTDHHCPAIRADGTAHLPEAAAIVDPNVPGCAFPWKSTCGAGIAFYLVAAVRAKLRDQGHSGGQVALDGLLDLVALGTVADVVPLERNNRILVAQGLARIRAGARPGIAALFRVAGRDVATATTEDLGFIAGPRLNSAGRLASMDLGIQLLIERDPGRADEMARELDGLNRERRTIEAATVDDALNGLSDGFDMKARALVFFGETWHEGIVGLVASRLKERFHRPVVALCRAQDGTIKGSGRSIPGLHMRDALAAVDAACPGLILRFGGHAMAAGLSLDDAQVDRFRSVFPRIVGRMVPDDALRQVVWSDGELAGVDLDLELARTLRDGGPWGNGFPEPLFHGTFRVRDCRILKDAHRALTIEKDGRVFRAIQFGNAERPPEEVLLAYRPQVNVWNGKEELQLVVGAALPAVLRHEIEDV